MEIKFSHNWNGKLSGQRVLSTIRGSDPGKLEYYQKGKGELVALTEKGFPRGEARLVSVEWWILGNLPTSLLCVDTGMPSRNQAMAVFAKFGLNEASKVILLTLVREPERAALGDFVVKKLK